MALHILHRLTVSPIISLKSVGKFISHRNLARFHLILNKFLQHGFDQQGQPETDCGRLALSTLYLANRPWRGQGMKEKWTFWSVNMWLLHCCCTWGFFLNATSVAICTGRASRDGLSVFYEHASWVCTVIDKPVAGIKSIALFCTFIDISSSIHVEELSIYSSKTRAFGFENNCNNSS